MKAFSLHGKRIILTGGTGQFGRVMADVLLDEGCRAALLDIAPQESVRLTEANGRRRYFACNVAEAEQARRAVREAAEWMGGLDGLINAAAKCRLDMAETLLPEEFDLTVKVSLYGAFHAAQAAFPYLKESGGNVVNVASIAGIIGLPRGTTHHSAAKAGMIGMTRSLALEWARHGVRVNCIVPGQFDTQPLRDIMQNPKDAADILAAIPMGRVGTSEEIARCVQFLLSDAAGFITGHALVADGGTTIA